MTVRSPYNPLYDEAGPVNDVPNSVDNDIAVAGLRHTSGDTRDIIGHIKDGNRDTAPTSRIFLPTPLPTTLKEDVEVKTQPTSKNNILTLC